MKWPLWTKGIRNYFFKKVNKWKEETSTTINSRVVLQGAMKCYECKMLEHLKNEYPLNKKIKKYKMKKKMLVETWSDCDPSHPMTNR